MIYNEVKKTLMLNPKKAEELQNKIYRKMSAEKKLRIAGQMFLLGKKLGKLREQKPYGKNKSKHNYLRGPALSSSQNFTRT